LGALTNAPCVAIKLVGVPGVVLVTVEYVGIGIGFDLYDVI
jgi:hypothetical protein